MSLSHIQHDLKWWQRGVVYQIYPRSFKDTTGDGVGDLGGIIECLDYLKDGTEQSLNVDAIWISPFYPSPMADFGYDVADYCNIDPVFGDLTIFDQLVVEAHQRGMKVIIDYIPNHTSDQHPWFREARSSQDNPKRNWYIWRDGKVDGSLPNNWGSAFGGPAWTWDDKTQQFYLHQFLREQPELNWREPEVRTAMMDVLRFWLERGVDGFRMDVVGMIIKDERLRDNPHNPKAPADLPHDDIYSRQLHLFNGDQDEVHEVMRDFRQLLDQYGDRCAIGEVWYGLPRWVKYYGENGDELHLPFNFRLMHLPWEAEAIRISIDKLEAALPSFAWPNYVLGNHDATRLASRIGEPQARVAAMLLLTLRGTPTLYYGDEIGMVNGIISPDRVQDPQGRRLGPERNRDIGRTPMQWNNSPSAGFSLTESWLPVSPDYISNNVATQSSNVASMLNLYRKLLWYRRTSPVLQGGSYRAIDSGEAGCFTYFREHTSGSMLVALNFNDFACTLSVDDHKTGVVAISTHLDREERVSLSNLALRPNEGVIVEIEL